MRYGYRHIPALLRTPLGRKRLRLSAFGRMWGVLRVVGGFYRRTALRTTRVVTVVGSFGKTTTARAVTAALGLPENPRIEANTSSSVPAALLRRPPGARYAVLEIGIAKPGEMALHAWTVRPDVTVVTSIGSEHNRFLGTLEATRAEKFEMVRALPRTGTAVLNGDDPRLLWMAERSPAPVLTYGFGPGNDVRATRLCIDWPHGTVFTLHAGGGSYRVRTRLVGWPSVHGLVGGAAVAHAEGIALADALPALESLGPTHGRLQLLALPGGVVVLHDGHKGAFETYDAALDVLEAIPGRRRLAVVGRVDEVPGTQGDAYRHIGRRLARICERVIFLGTRKSLRPLRSGARAGGMSEGSLTYVRQDVRKAIEALLVEVGPGDVVLLKGRSSQRLERVALALMGKEVRCNLGECHAHPTRCGKCPMLEKGWDVDSPLV